ncbi:MAG: zinc ribbon domain-containing protein [Acidimicrobiia bacterium]
MEQLKSIADLLDLHDIDLQIDKLLDDRSSLPELEDYRVAHAEVDRLQAELTSAQAVLKTTDQSLSRTNGELEIAAEKAASEQNRLYAGGLSARDADYMRREVELLYKKVSSYEDDVLTLMEQKETVEAQVEVLTEDLASASAEKDRLASLIQDQWRVIDKELAVKEERKSIAAELVDEYLMDIYDDLRERRKGRVVGRLEDGVCGACHLQLSAAEVARVTKEDPPRCIHCRAVLVV